MPCTHPPTPLLLKLPQSLFHGGGEPLHTPKLFSFGGGVKINDYICRGPRVDKSSSLPLDFSPSLPPFLSQGLAHIWNSLKAEMTSLAPITILKIPFFPPSSPLALPCSLLAPSFFPFCRCIHVHFIFICLFLLVYRECIRGAQLWCARILFISHVHTRAQTHIP